MAEQNSFLEYEDRMLVVFDLDMTVIGDVKHSADRDCLELNIPWNWPEGLQRGLSVSDIVTLLKEGCLRPGFKELIMSFMKINAIIVFYTHAEEKWGKKVCDAVEIAVGIEFLDNVFYREDCADQQHFTHRSQKCLMHIIKKLGLSTSHLSKTIMFEDNVTLPFYQHDRLVVVPAYRFTPYSKWNDRMTSEFLQGQSPQLRKQVFDLVCVWGVPPTQTTIECLDRIFYHVTDIVNQWNKNSVDDLIKFVLAAIRTIPVSITTDQLSPVIAKELFPESPLVKAARD
jgi:hypothetical protein